MNKTYLAQNLKINGKDIAGPLNSQITDLGSLVNRLMLFIVPLAAVILLFVLIWGGIDLMMSRGTPEKIKGARAKITAGLIGFFLLVSAYFIARLVATIFGLGTGIL